MNGRMAKNIHRTINKKLSTDLEYLFETLSKASLRRRIVYVFKILFKWNPKVKFISARSKKR